MYISTFFTIGSIASCMLYWRKRALRNGIHSYRKKIAYLKRLSVCPLRNGSIDMGGKHSKLNSPDSLAIHLT